MYVKPPTFVVSKSLEIIQVKLKPSWSAVWGKIVVNHWLATASPFSMVDRVRNIVPFFRKEYVEAIRMLLLGHICCVTASKIPSLSYLLLI